MRGGSRRGGWWSGRARRMTPRHTILGTLAAVVSFVPTVVAALVGGPGTGLYDVRAYAKTEGWVGGVNRFLGNISIMYLGRDSSNGWGEASGSAKYAGWYGVGAGIGLLVAKWVTAKLGGGRLRISRDWSVA